MGDSSRAAVHCRAVSHFFDPTGGTWIGGRAERTISVGADSLTEIAVPLAKLSEQFYQKFGH
ncbi:MAG TPA: hypothetical protein VFI79_08030, partial [Gemmatimonadales bacterium]|nr:hypothetical protein [Gemmatimonadales bacterium]